MNRPTPIDRVAGRVARQIIRRFGKDAVLRRTTTTFTPGTNATTSTSRDHLIKIAPPTTVDVRYVNGTTIQMGDVQVLMAAEGLPFAPSKAATLSKNVSQADAVLIDGAPYPIHHVKPIYSGQRIAAYTAYARR